MCLQEETRERGVLLPFIVLSGCHSSSFHLPSEWRIKGEGGSASLELELSSDPKYGSSLATHKAH